MPRLLKHFLRGLVLLAPVAITLWVISRVFLEIDGWLDLPWPGAGFAATIVIITLFGFVASNFLASQALSIFDELLQKVPFVRLVYTSAKDLLNAFVGEKRRFKAPVLVTIHPGGDVRCLGFITQESLDALGLPDTSPCTSRRDTPLPATPCSSPSRRSRPLARRRPR